MDRPREDMIIQDTAKKIAELEKEYHTRRAFLGKRWEDAVKQILDMQTHYKNELEESKKKCSKEHKRTLEQLRTATKQKYEAEMNEKRALGQGKVSEDKIAELTAPLTGLYVQDMKELDRKILAIETACKATKDLQTMIHDADKERKSAEEKLARPIVALDKEHEAVVSSLRKHQEYTLAKLKRDAQNRGWSRKKSRSISSRQKGRKTKSRRTKKNKRRKSKRSRK